MYLYIINGNHFELPPVLLRTQRFSDTLELVNRVDESFEKKENRHKVAFENNLKQLCKYKEDILRGNQDYVIKEVYDLYKDVLLEYNLNTDKYENTLSQKDRQIISELKNDSDKTKLVLSGIMGLKEANRKTNCKIVRDKYNQLDTFSKTLIYEDYKLLKLHEEILEFEELVESTLVYKNNNIIDSLEKINDVWEKYQSIQYTYSSMEVFTTTFSSENVAYKKLLQFEKNRIDEVVKNIEDVNTTNNCILYTRYNFDCLNDYYKQREYISNNGKKQYRELLEETDKKYNQYSNDLEKMSKEIKEVEVKISLLQPGSKKIYEVRDRFYNLTKEQQNNVQNKNQLMTLLDNYNRDVRYSFNMTSRVINIFTLILGIVLFIFLVLDISISITESISLTAVLSVVGMFLVVISSLSTIMLKLKTYGEKRNARNGRIAWYIFNYVVVILLIVLTMIFIPKLYEVLGNFRYKTLLIPLVLVLLSAVLNISNIKKFDTNDKLIDSKLFSGKLYLVLFVLLISLSNVSYKIEYDLSGGDLFGEPKSYGNIVSDIKLPIPTKEGYEFGGWYDNDDYNGEVLEVIAVGTTGNVKLYAKWTPIKYTIEYELKNGELEKGVYHYTLEEEVELPNAFKKGYKFLGWYDNNSYNGSPITKIEKGSTENFKLYARWEIIEYTIQYNLNGGIWGSKKGIETYNVLTDEELVIPEYAGYTFVGWYEDSDFNGSKVEKITEGTTGDKVLHARWNKVTYVINFLNPSGSSVKSITSLPNELITLPIPVHSNPKYYTFKGWKYNGEIIKQLKVTQNVTLEAVWEPEKYVITYDPNGGNLLINSDEFTYNEDYTLPIPIRDGYTFGGWYYNNKKYEGGKWDIAENITLKACWKANTYNFKFNLNNASIKMTPVCEKTNQNVLYGSSSSFVVPTAEYYVFEGWYTSDGIKVSDQYGKFTDWSICKNDTLVAHWKQQYENAVYIKDAVDLKEVLKNTESGRTYMLIDNINDVGMWTPISNFKGILDGQNHTISGMTYTFYDGADVDWGMFVTINSGAKVMDISFQSCKATYVAPSQGYAVYEVKFGFVAAFNRGEISGCTFSGNEINIDANTKVSSQFVYVGIAVCENFGIIKNCTSNGNNVINIDCDTVKDGNFDDKNTVAVAGGLCAYNQSGGEISSCTSINNTITTRVCYLSDEGEDVKAVSGGMIGFQYGALTGYNYASGNKLSAIKRYYEITKNIWGQNKGVKLGGEDSGNTGQLYARN